MRLTKYDVDCIKDDWLTDNAIAFWEEYLEHEKLANYPRANIVLLRPTMSLLLMHSPDYKAIADALPNFSRTTHIFLPINNNKNVAEAEGGTHWSLLLVSVIDGVAFHYDSVGYDNEVEALNTTRKLSSLLDKHLRFTQMRDTPQQQNSIDCGVFVCSFIEKLLLKKLLVADAGEKVRMSLSGESINARKVRKRMVEVIEDFRKEGERRRSRSASPHRAKTPPRIGDD